MVLYIEIRESRTSQVNDVNAVNVNVSEGNGGWGETEFAGSSSRELNGVCSFSGGWWRWTILCIKLEMHSPE
jgi:hypothetical protein